MYGTEARFGEHGYFFSYGMTWLNEQKSPQIEDLPNIVTKFPTVEFRQDKEKLCGVFLFFSGWVSHGVTRIARVVGRSERAQERKISKKCFL